MVRVIEAKRINFKENFKLYWGLVKKYKWFLFAIILFVLINAVTHVADKFLFKVIVDRGNEFAAGELLRNSFVDILVVVAISYLAIIAIRVGFKWVQLRFTHRLETEVIFDFKKKFFDHIVHLSHGFHTTHKTGSMISRMTRGASAIERVTDFIIFNTLPLVFELILVGASLIYFDLATAGVIVVIAFVFVVYSYYFLQKQRKANIDFNNAEDFEKANMGDIFTNIDSIKYFGKESMIKNKYKNLSLDTKKKMFNSWWYNEWLSSGHTLITGLGAFFLVFFPILRVLQGEISIGTLVFIYTAYGNIFGPLYGFVGGLRGFYRSMADFESLSQYSKVENDIKDKKNARNLEVKKGEIEFRDVEFNYGKRLLFGKFNLSIKKNEKVALVGHSGCGKTTLVKLLYRLFDVNSGKILIDGKDIRDFKQESLRGELSIVPQEAILFDDTIYNNIRFSNPKASRKDVLRAMKFAQLDRFVQNLPKKENTIVGERGVKLSGGERQRVSIARALLANKKILVLDEATSSLDSMTEHEIQKDLFRLMEGRTSIIIAHRLSTIMQTDKIIVMENGKIVQIGKHKNLIRKRGPYRVLWELQKGGYIGE
ncbi:hypothetical protein COU62_01040 [Candidatus Pacearchaeota archaeon CG10_big_fil_rev_8_21_14_0_10_35_219]|nr:MAG: hypothetical protein AUJ63_01210 [Candidatus Pacearchaeota archaeon CG1_02_35_32]PIO08149.1 MAG: hypothetical protein COU62_01040 [Candidatus Pacearchaeota archaeon CG10_big_fil_rev_8_21_14_0_10_35_219]PJA70207.1 MAG: hypothetical protein CO155_01020 [Candidatus Pacearchaeota archaeon CG_4_9_14_3_um_filter_35_19]PJB93712.1 MAG: hypothetical protein CO081_04950 [Candidatus Pacearchaeota archaeon CG_4_9_14_0_8_um_filter_35_24]